MWPCGAEVYPALLRAGVRVARCHDVALAERLLLGREGRGDEPATLAAAHARLHGAPAPAERAAPGAQGGRPGERPPGRQRGQQGALFEAAGTETTDARAVLDALTAVHADQLRRIAADERPARFGALVAAESAGELVAAEMTFAGMPWRADVHDRLLADMLGPRPPAALAGTRPARLTELAGQISAALGGRPVNPDSPTQLVKALATAGVRVSSTRFWELREVDHPAIPPLLEYKELSRLHAAHGWAWLDDWVCDGRFRPEYVVGGVVSGRWASRGGGALQIPRVLRRAVVADPGWVLVVADAAQLEPRVLAALAGDRAFAEAATGGDLYEGLASVFGGDRNQAKKALLSAMYGGAGRRGGPAAGRAPAALPRRVRLRGGGGAGRARKGGWSGPCWAGRARRRRPRGAPSPRSRATRRPSGIPARAAPRAPAAGSPATSSSRPARPTGRWCCWSPCAGGWRPCPARTRPPARPGRWDPLAPHLVFFQHDEVLVHCPEAMAQAVVAAVDESAAEAGRAVFGVTPVRFPMTTAVVGCYADAK